MKNKTKITPNQYSPGLEISVRLKSCKKISLQMEDKAENKLIIFIASAAESGQERHSSCSIVD